MLGQGALSLRDRIKSVECQGQNVLAIEIECIGSNGERRLKKKQGKRRAPSLLSMVS